MRRNVVTAVTGDVSPFSSKSSRVKAAADPQRSSAGLALIQDLSGQRIVVLRGESLLPAT